MANYSYTITLNNSYTITINLPIHHHRPENERHRWFAIPALGVPPLLFTDSDSTAGV